MPFCARSQQASQQIERDPLSPASQGGTAMLRERHGLACGGRRLAVTEPGFDPASAPKPSLLHALSGPGPWTCLPVHSLVVAAGPAGHRLRASTFLWSPRGLSAASSKGLPDLHPLPLPEPCGPASILPSLPPVLLLPPPTFPTVRPGDTGTQHGPFGSLVYTPSPGWLGLPP